MNNRELYSISSLTSREYQVFVDMGEGLSTKEIAAIKGRLCSIKTVEAHVAKIRKKTGLQSICKIRELSTRFLTHLKLNKLKVEPVDLRPKRVFVTCGTNPADTTDPKLDK